VISSTAAKAPRDTIARKPALAVLLALLAAGLLHAEDGPRVMLEVSEGTPAVGSTWVLTVLSDHHNPNQVSVLEPPFAAGLVLEQVLQGSRIVNLGSWLAGESHAPTHERWTATEYRFVLNAHGSFAFEPFTVTTPRGQARTQPFVLTVQNPQAAAMPTRETAWAEVPASLETGESFILALRSESADPERPAPRAGLFMPAVPPGHILESLPITPAQAAQGTVLRMRLIPLEAGEFALGRRQFSYGGAVFEIPDLRIPVSQSAAGLSIAAPEAEAAVPVAAAPAPPFPSYNNAASANPRLHQRHRAEFEAAFFTALNLWERGYPANALAVLRRNERDHRAGALFADVRREAEAALGLAGTRDERRRLSLPFLGERAAPTAVLRGTPVRRIPDAAGEEIARFREGQPVRIGRESGAGTGEHWVLVTAIDESGTSGWIPGENIILY